MDGLYAALRVAHVFDHPLEALPQHDLARQTSHAGRERGLAMKHSFLRAVAILAPLRSHAQKFFGDSISPFPLLAA
jgi:hypothetical protein